MSMKLETIMDGDDEGLLPPALERSMPEDAAEYMLFVVDDGHAKTSTASSRAAASRPRARLDQIRKAALKLSEDLTKEYIWQRDSFNLEVVSRKSLLYLRGLTSYGDCVEDEWLVVYMLRELSKSFPDVWVRIGDSDGEFLLVEAAKAVPRWLNPEMDANRVWIHGGKLKIIPLEATTKPSVELADAVQVIRTVPNSLVHTPALEKEAFYRLNKYPKHVSSSIYHTRLILPRKIAFVLHDRPRAIAPAVEAFVARDPISTKKIFGPTTTNTESDKSSTPCQHQLQFPPTDLVVISTKFTRVLYAQIRGQRFTPPNGWPAAFSAFCEKALLSDTENSEPKQKGKEKAASPDEQTPDLEKLKVMVELSMKLTCGFELMASTVDTSNNRIVREVGLVLEDLADDEGAATELPSDNEIQAWKDFDREDDDSWLNIDFDDFERELDSGRNEVGQTRSATKGGGPTAESATPKQSGPVDVGAGFGDAGVQTDLRRIVSQFQAFLNDKDAGIEGAEFDEMDEDDEDDDDDEYEDEDDSDEDNGDGIDFDEDEFNRLMREMMGLPPADNAPQVANKTTTPTTTSAAEKTAESKTSGLAGDDDADDVEGILNLAAQFEAELKGHGALKVNPPKSKGKDTSSTKEIAVGEQGRSALTHSSMAAEVDSDSDDDDGEVDVDFNLAKNLLESFKGQEGMAGPAGNILSMLGMTLPRDNDDDDEDEKED
ncbi:sgt1-like protein [Ophiostoma piceae UAMH 11346]|uniref:Sgt1-like protein n=1 Tax=Ophiostoma piceae (strain UAMH 11346) TaxID=1262450 RepID=S3BW93_OPHP1|nr:sgt1-like protein [Ophiostoma piceae UAMH 11346]